MALKQEPPLVAIMASFNQTRDQYSLLLSPFVLLLAIGWLSRLLSDYLFMASRDDLLPRIVVSAVEAPLTALAVVIGFRLFSLTSRLQS